ncbi:unnamed protein product [Prunus brigantina]
MAAYVSKCPRGAYLNSRDLDLGTNKDANTSYAQASIWGLSYFKNNFRRLAQVKTLVDPAGAHDYEGLSYVSETPFIIIDLFKLRSIDIDIEESSWVESGATIREFYYAIAKKSKVYGFPGGICHTIGVGGHISGGGFDTLFGNYHYGLAADNILDAKIVDINGRVLDGKSMGEDLFWAIRGGGGSSFGVILAWKLRLVPVPPSVTVYRESKTIEQVIFDFLFLETFEKLLPWMQDNFPDLCLDQTKFTEMSWIESVLYFAGLPSNEVDVLLQRTQPSKRFFKAKSDYVTEPISEAGLEDLWQRMLQLEASELIPTPYGGRMSEISASETPFPHRKGNLFEIQYLVFWNDDKETEKNIGWLRRLYASMAPYVSKSPRAAYLNYRDLDLDFQQDLGRNHDANTSYAQASIWGLKYFKGNFRRLVHVKTLVDPGNFLRNEQSIPVLPSGQK